MSNGPIPLCRMPSVPATPPWNTSRLPSSKSRSTRRSNFGCVVPVFVKSGYVVPVPFGNGPVGRSSGSCVNTPADTL